MLTNSGVPLGQKRLGLRVDVVKLGIAIDVLVAFSSLAVRLQAIAHAAQQIADHGWANLMPFLPQLLHETTQAAGCPQQRLHRIAPRRRLDQLLQIGRKGWILKRLLLAPAPLLRTRPGGAEILWRMSDKP